MATAPSFPVLTVDEYLNSSWRPDREYVDGILMERTCPTIAHALLQRILILYFAQWEESLGLRVLPEVRTQIVEGARYRIPDILLCRTPLPEGKIVNAVPLAVIEILSPGDKMAEVLDRFRDYARLGVLHILQMDPERFIAHRFEQGSLTETRFENLALSHGSLPVDIQGLCFVDCAKIAPRHTVTPRTKASERAVSDVLFQGPRPW